MYFPPEDNETEVIMMPNAEPRVIESLYGHGVGGLGLSTQDDDDFRSRFDGVLRADLSKGASE
jgi:hypothetical protein